MLIAQQNLALGGSSVLRFVGTPTNNATLLTYAGTRSGTFQVSGLPSTYQVAYGPAQNGTVFLRAVPPATVLLVQ